MIDFASRTCHKRLRDIGKDIKFDRTGRADSAPGMTDSAVGITDFIASHGNETLIAESGYFDDVNDRLRVGLSDEFFDTSSTLRHAPVLRGNTLDNATVIDQSLAKLNCDINNTSVKMGSSDSEQFRLGAAGGFQSLPQIELLRFLNLREVPNLLSRWTAASATSKVCSRRH